MKDKSINKAKTLSYKIWVLFAKILVIVFLAIVIINSTLIEQIKRFASYQELEQHAHGYLHKQQKSKYSKDMPLFILDPNSSKDNMIEEVMEKWMFHNGEWDKLISRITSEVLGADKPIIKGKINYSIAKLYYYYAVEYESKIYVFAEEQESPLLIYIVVAIIIGLVLGLLLIISKKVARKVVSPIDELQVFLNEVANKNWDYSIPLCDIIEVNHLIEGLENMKKALKEADHREKEFLQSASHDLKTPVMVIKGYIEAVKDGKYSTDDGQYLDIIKEESDRLERKIVQLLRLNTLDHINREKDQWREVSIDRIINKLVNKYKGIYPHIQWKINVIPLEITGDAEALIIAFENILDNQIRFAKNVIKIDITQDKEVIIYNDGPLFKIEDPNELFESHTKDKQGNFGLGLAIVKRVIGIHGGMVVASNCSNGVQFKLTFA
ncbi:HAMP domain-containing sensor histidine kinase [Clostridiaceae bacterium M8S5]|nr:HAMP domain-containing sensor histidine kinase [Clostridiaceae bacterium M8S5]